jgi:hypothetical protein
MDVYSSIGQTGGLRRFACRAEALDAALQESRYRRLPVFELDTAGRSVLLHDPQHREEICAGYDA